MLMVHAVGLLFYLGGMLLFLSVVVGTFLNTSREATGDELVGSLPILLVSIALIVMGRVISWKYGDERSGLLTWATPMEGEPEQSKLGQLGYQLPPETDTDEQTPFEYADGTVRVICTECGEKNSGDFRFCSNCSAELPE